MMTKEFLEGPSVHNQTERITIRGAASFSVEASASHFETKDGEHAEPCIDLEINGGPDMVTSVYEALKEVNYRFYGIEADALQEAFEDDEIASLLVKIIKKEVRAEHIENLLYEHGDD